MRVFVRRERASTPGAQLSSFEEADCWRYSLWVTNVPETTRGNPGAHGTRPPGPPSGPASYPDLKSQTARRLSHRFWPAIRLRDFRVKRTLAR